jgi:O-methyltransferase
MIDRRVFPGSRISRLPRWLRTPALLARSVIHPRRRPEYVYEDDGLATIHHSPFLEDEAFDQLYWQMERDWYLTRRHDVRWRMWILTRCARQAQHLPGNFAEFGVYRGGCALMALSATDLGPQRRFYLFDSFAGIPSDHLTELERRQELAGALADTSSSYVYELLGSWREQIVIREGDLFDTLPTTETGDLSFAHFDLNASAPTKAALEYAYPRALPGALFLFDDYGSGYVDQRAVIDRFFTNEKEEPIALPTGQALMIKAR